MKIRVNGDWREFPDGATIADVLADLGLPTEETVAEWNGDIVERARFQGTPLTGNDSLELIHFVGGG